MKFRKKPVVIHAVQWDSHKPFASFKKVVQMTDLSAPFYLTNVDGPSSELKIKTLEGEMLCGDRDWVIKGVNGEFYPCKPDIFEKTYEAVEE